MPRRLPRAVTVALTCVLGAVAALVLGAVTGAPAGAATPPVRPGARVTVHGAGFAAGVPVTVRLIGTRPDRVVRSDRHGRVTVTLRAPRRPGRYRVVLTGRPPAGAVPRPPRGRPGDRQVLRVLVPRLLTYTITVRSGGRGSGSGSAGGGNSGGSGLGGRGVSQGGGATAGASAGRGTPATTGTDLGVLATLAALAVSGGALTLAAARRRRAGP